MSSNSERLPYGKPRKPNPNLPARKPRWQDGKTVESRAVMAHEARVAATYAPALPKDQTVAYEAMTYEQKRAWQDAQKRAGGG